jgi:hypothetical protein
MFLLFSSFYPGVRSFISVSFLRRYAAMGLIQRHSCVLQAIEIYHRRWKCPETLSQVEANRLRTAAAEVLAAEIGIQRDVVRDIWIRRSWWKETKPFWTQEETQSFLDRHLCGDCKSTGVRDLDDACASCPINERKKSQAAAASRSAQKRMISQTKAEKLNAYQVRANCSRSHNQNINRTRKKMQAFVKNSVPEIKAANPLFTQQQIMATVGERWRAQKPMVEESNKAGGSPKRMHQGSASVEMGRITGDF